MLQVLLPVRPCSKPKDQVLLLQVLDDLAAPGHIAWSRLLNVENKNDTRFSLVRAQRPVCGLRLLHALCGFGGKFQDWRLAGTSSSCRSLMQVFLMSYDGNNECVATYKERPSYAELEKVLQEVSPSSILLCCRTIGPFCFCVVLLLTMVGVPFTFEVDAVLVVLCWSPSGPWPLCRLSSTAHLCSDSDFSIIGQPNDTSPKIKPSYFLHRCERPPSPPLISVQSAYAPPQKKL